MLTFREKSHLLSSLSSWPHVAVSRLIRSQDMRVPAVNMYGVCGRAMVTEGAYRPLAAYLDQGLDVRKGLGGLKIEDAAQSPNTYSIFNG